jgi:hypothetical protein
MKGEAEREKRNKKGNKERWKGKKRQEGRSQDR